MRLFHATGALALAAALMLGATTGAHAQAFGIREGMPLSQLRVQQPLGGEAYAVVPPQPNPLFAVYAVGTAPGAGVCKVFAVGEEIENDPDGALARQRVAQLTSALTARHGAPTGRVDRIAPTALWSAPDEWAMAISQRERSYFVRWGADEANKITLINLAVAGKGSRTTRVDITYEFTNIAACDAQADRQAAQGL